MDKQGKTYVLVIHSGELRYPLLEAGEKLGLKVGTAHDNMAVVADGKVEIALDRAGFGIDLPRHPAWQEILQRQRRGERIGAVVGCPILTADVLHALRMAKIPLPEDNIHLVCMLPPEHYHSMEQNHPGITALTQNARSATNAYEDGASAMVPVLTDTLAATMDNPPAYDPRSRIAGGDTPRGTRKHGR